MLSAAQVLFLSDVPAELDAARQAGMRVALCVREDAPRAHGYAIVTSFDEVCP